MADATPEVASAMNGHEHTSAPIGQRSNLKTLRLTGHMGRYRVPRDREQLRPILFAGSSDHEKRPSAAAT
jgi:hypothetical protein